MWNSFSEKSCDAFLQELKKYGVTTVVRVCEATYDATLVVKEGIQVLVSLYLQTCDFFMTVNASNKTCPLFTSKLNVTLLNTCGQLQLQLQYFSCGFTFLSSSMC